MRSMTLATVFAAASGYLVLWVASRALGAESYGAFAAFWAAFFALGGVANGLMQETTRAVRAAEDAAAPRHDHGSLLRFGLVVGAILAAGVVASAPAWEVLGLARHGGAAVAILALGIWGFSLQAAVAGALSGTEHWNHYALLLTVDAALRLLAAGLTWALGAPQLAFEVTTVVGALTWIGMLASPVVRTALGSALDVDARRFWRNTAQAMLAGSGTSLMITGFPLLVTATARPGDSAALIGATVLAITLTRAPLLVPLTSFQSAIIVWFVHRRAAGLRALVVPVGGVIGVGLIAALAAWAVANPLVRWFFGDSFGLPGAVFGLLTAAGVGTAALMITGAAALAMQQHTIYNVGWWVACVASVGLLLTVPWQLDTRAAWALFAGPVLGVATHIVGLAAQRQAAEEEKT